jgi:hypothetical protein
MNDLKIYAEVAKKPGIGAAELAKNLDMTLATISTELRVMVDAGDLVRTKVVDAVTERDRQAYSLSDQFKASRTYQTLVVQIADALESKIHPEPAKLVKLPDTATPASVPATRHGPGMTKVDRAVDFVNRHGAASDSELRDTMGLLDKASVAAYIAPAIKSGRVHRDDKDKLWKPGEAKPKALDTVEVVGNVILATRDATPVPDKVFTALTEMAVAAATELSKQKPLEPETKPMQSVTAPSEPTVKPAERAYRCAIWSDGKVEIHKNGYSVKITQNELAEIAAFVAERRAA